MVEAGAVVPVVVVLGLCIALLVTNGVVNQPKLNNSTEPFTFSSTSNNPSPLQSLGASGSASTSCSRFAVIALSDDVGGTKDAFPLLIKLQSIYPLQKYATALISTLSDEPADPLAIPAWINSDLKPKMQELENLAQAFAKQGMKYIHLPSKSSMVRPFANGYYVYTDIMENEITVPLFGGKNIKQRYPADVLFTGSNIGTPAVDLYSNIVRFSDVNSGYDASILTGNVASFGVLPGVSSHQILFINQAGDDFSLSNFKDVVDVLKDGGYANQIQSVNVSFNGTLFDDGGIADVANIVAQAAAGYGNYSTPVTRLVIAMNPNGISTASNAFRLAFGTPSSGLNLATLAAMYPSMTSVFWGLNFAPGPTTPPVTFDVENGFIVGIPMPGVDYTSLGLPAQPNAFSAAINFDPYVLDALKFASKCYTIPLVTSAAKGADATLQGTPYKFIGQTLVSQWLVSSRIPAGFILPTNGYTGFQISALWSGQGQAIYPPPTGGL